MIITLTYHYQLVWKGENGTIVIITPWKRAWSCIWTNFNPLHPDMVRAELCQICQVRLKLAKWFWRRFKNFVNEFSYLNKFESISDKDALCQVCLKLAKRFWRRSWKCEKVTDRQLHGRTDNGLQAIRKANWALSPCKLKTKKWRKKIKLLKRFFHSLETSVLTWTASFCFIYWMDEVWHGN